MLTGQAQDHLSNLTNVFLLSMAMFDQQDEDGILRLALTKLPELGSCQVVAGFLSDSGGIRRFDVGPAESDLDLENQIRLLDGSDGQVTTPGAAWAWAFSLRDIPDTSGYIVAGSAQPPPDDERSLLMILAQQTGAALANAALRRRRHEDAEELRRLNDKATRIKRQLILTMADMQRQTRVHDILTQVAASGTGEAGIAQAVHELTGLPVVVEDRFGNLRAWAGPGHPGPHRKPSAADHEQTLVEARRHGKPMRHRDRLITLAQARGELLGTLALVDPERTAGRQEVLALEHAGTVLAMELAHLRSLAEAEIRLSRDLVDDLVAGLDEDSAYARAEAIGHDLHGAHYVAIAEWNGRQGDGSLANAAGHLGSALGIELLVSKRSSSVLLIIRGRPIGEHLYRVLSNETGSPTGAIGIGGRCESPSELPRSFKQSLRALETRKASHTPHGAMAYEELGIYRLLAGEENNHEIEQYVREWLGLLLDYDNKHGSELVQTLSEYFECGGNYDATARTLVIHRSTLRYRLQRIREVSGFDLAEVDNRLNLHVATRAWKVLRGTD